MQNEIIGEQANCPLCLGAETCLFTVDSVRVYFQCSTCELVFVPPRYHLPANDEKAQYDLHENRDEPRYRHFLNRLCQPLSARLKDDAIGLDFGCGPGPVLATMFREQGYRVELFDKFYFPDEDVWRKRYDFITASEVFEHLQHPRQVIDRLWACLVSNGVLGVMTKLVISPMSFSTWHYKTDPTHIIFFSVSTFEWLARYLNADLDFLGKDVMLLRKKS